MSTFLSPTVITSVLPFPSSFVFICSTLCSEMNPCSFHVIVVSSHCCRAFHCMNIPQFLKINFTINGHLGCFQVLAITNSVAVNVLYQSLPAEVHTSSILGINKNGSIFAFLGQESWYLPEVWIFISFCLNGLCMVHVCWPVGFFSFVKCLFKCIVHFASG